MNRNNMFITFEGGDGSGKTTQLKKMAEFFSLHIERNVVIGREPGDTALGLEIRKLLLSNEPDYNMCSESELFLFLADRAQHVNQVIRPCLSRGDVFICDRYSHSTMAYQLAARGLNNDNSLIIDMIKSAECGVSPDVVVWIDTPIDECIDRIESRASFGEEKNRLDFETRSFHEKVHDGFRSIFSNTNSTDTIVLKINGTGTANEVHTRVIKAFIKLLN